MSKENLQDNSELIAKSPIGRKIDKSPVIVLQKPKNIGATSKRLMSYMKKSSLLIAISIAVAVIGTVMQVLSPKMLGNATTTIFNGLKAGTGVDFTKLGTILLMVAAMYVGVFLTSFLQQRLMVLVSQKTAYALRNTLKSKMNRVPVSYFDKNANGNLMSVAVNDIDNITTNLQEGLTNLISSAILIIGFLWIMLSISPLLTLISCAMAPASILIMKLFTPQVKKNNKGYFKSMGELGGQIEESYQGFAVLKSFNGEDEAIRKFGGFNENMVQTGWKAKFFGGIMIPCMFLVQNLIYVLVAVLGAVRVVSGTILIGDMQAFLQYSLQFSSPVGKLSGTWNNVLSMIVSAERVFDMLDAVEDIPEEKNSLLSPSNESAKVLFDHVKFGYTDEPLMKDFNMEVQDGQMVAVVGHTGAGKTTLINLLERFYEIQGGSICVDGADIRCMARCDLRRRMGIVLQDTWLFSGTIYENIRYGNENATEEQIYAAAKAAYADEFIQKLPDGYNTVLDEDAGNISQGQRQLITIARAFAADPEILILDEATSNVDSRTELIIQSAMKRLLKGRTSFVVAHRLSTIYGADKILVMDHGDIVETGTHKELMAMDGVYSDIYNSQFAQRSA